jgi:hypothetical protein
MPPPVTGPCGGENQPPCAPEPAIVIDGVEYWTRDQVWTSIMDGYNKGVADCSGLDRKERALPNEAG